MFSFPNINLLDSSHHGLCDGMLQFSISTRNGLPDATAIFNHAGIYFDDNPVVMTNTVENVAGCNTTAVSSVQPKAGAIQLFPSPTTDELTIKIDRSTYLSFTISYSIGQEIINRPLPGTNGSTIQASVSVSSLPAGLYYIIFRGDSGNEVRKFVKL